jgi:hypothetical protein
LAAHPPAQFLSFVLMDNLHLVFATVLVRQAFSPQASRGQRVVTGSDGFVLHSGTMVSTCGRHDRPRYGPRLTQH